jgi:23S rRNA pseudouridine1911/1915/1917 synthase
MSETELLFVEDSEENLRLDQLLANRFTGSYSRTYFQQLIDEGLVLLNGNQVKKRIKPKVADEIEIEFIISKGIDLIPQNIPLDILYEDDDLLVVNKPPGMVVHPAVGHYENTFVHALLWHCKDLPNMESLRPGIVHRLDKDTSGILVAAKTSFAHQALVKAFSERVIKKRYLAITLGNPGNGEIRTLIGRDPKNRQKMAVVTENGKESITRFETLKLQDDLALVSIDLMTGRTHQIRVHMQHHKTPILGDILYGSKKTNEKFKIDKQLLHAWQIEFVHPKSGTMLKFEAPIPPKFFEMVKN